MKKLKSLMSFALATIMLMAASSALAAEPVSELSLSPEAKANFSAIPEKLQAHILADQELSSAAKYAYMNLDTASEPMKEKILSARNTIILSEGWTVDGKGYISHADGTIEVLPKFSDLFPGWDLPVWNDEKSLPAAPTVVSPLGDTFGTLVRDTRNGVYIRKYNPNVTTPSMGTYRANSSETFIIRVRSLTTCSTCNIGVTNSNGVSVGWKPRVAPGEYFYFFPKFWEKYSIRVSSYDSAGYGNFYIDH